jgi:hypothetical protein
LIFFFFPAPSGQFIQLFLFFGADRVDVSQPRLKFGLDLATLELTLDDLGLRRNIDQLTFLEMKRNIY